MLLSEMTILTALRTAAMSAVAAKHLARTGSKTMVIIGNDAQSEFQALAFKAIAGVTELRLYDIALLQRHAALEISPDMVLR